LATRVDDIELTVAYNGGWINNDEPMTSSRNESTMLRGSEEKECLILSLMHQKFLTNFSRRAL